LEQDSDIVAFIYRDDTYHPDSSDKGVAEVAVAKHRNGPTAKVRLAFVDHLTKFSDLARRHRAAVGSLGSALRAPEPGGGVASNQRRGGVPVVDAEKLVGERVRARCSAGGMPNEGSRAPPSTTTSRCTYPGP
jgi:hypothetical protein